ncbi:MAG: KpsF/GutQ family sugar-phosphate isomerase [Armatimonadetes bacterium]|nr:KpsF/GutQ family sugar-phosphate isomerase [Armatimonadota bacterium]
MRDASPEAILNQARQTLDIEVEAIRAAAARLGDDFVRAAELVLHTSGRVIVSGIGKSGAVGRKIASTLASTGTPAHFMHPAEALHGDLGMIADGDVVIMLSNSGETREILDILPAVKRRQVKVIAICGVRDSTLSQAADVTLDAACEREACPLGLAPTASALVALALGDALAMAVMAARGFSTDDYAATHPGGALGRRLLLRVGDVMHTGADNPTITPDATVLDALLTMSTAPVRGVVTVVDRAGRLVGLFTDGDFRVLMQREVNHEAVLKGPIAEVMTRTPTTVGPDILAAEALSIMERREFDNLPVVDEEGRAIGMVDIQDLMKLRVI